jgi:chromosome segregation ATPase
VKFLTFDPGNELEEARKKFQEEISSVQNLRSTITSALERMRLESDMLQREEAALRAHEERVVATFERLKEKETSYKEKGKERYPQVFHFHFFSLPFLLRFFFPPQ